MAQKVLGEYLFQYFAKLGVTHAFGIPGDYALPLFRYLSNSDIDIITLAHEPAVGFAADGYARVHGMGLACVTYCVGGLNMVNSVACAYAEKSPVIIISGAPSLEEHSLDRLVHHKVRTFDTQLQIYDEITCASVRIDNVEKAVESIEHVVELVKYHSLPGYIEIPYDLVDRKLPSPITHTVHIDTYLKKDDQEALEASIEEAVVVINNSKQPVVIIDVMLQRFNLTHIAVEFAEKNNLPIATTILGKSIVSETHPNYIGVYSGCLSSPETQKYVETSDCLIMLGTYVSDVFLGMYSSSLERNKTIFASHEKIQIGLHAYENVDFEEFLKKLSSAKIKYRNDFLNPSPYHELKNISKSECHRKLVADDIFLGLGTHLKPKSLVVADVGDAVIGSIGLRTKESKTFLSDAFYMSMGFAVPAAIGALMGQKYNKAYVLVGDGAFQMTGMELSTVAKYQLDMVVIIINNSGYGTQRMVVDDSFNDIHNWNYTKICEVLNYGVARKVNTLGEMETALIEAEKSSGLFLIEAIIDAESCSQSLQALGNRLHKLRNLHIDHDGSNDFHMQ